MSSLSSLESDPKMTDLHNNGLYYDAMTLLNEVKSLLHLFRTAFRIHFFHQFKNISMLSHYFYGLWDFLNDGRQKDPKMTELHNNDLYYDSMTLLNEVIFLF